jgi:hypothetical protein
LIQFGDFNKNGCGAEYEKHLRTALLISGGYQMMFTVVLRSEFKLKEGISWAKK